jgi:phosphatidylserine decarboxylase
MAVVLVGAMIVAGIETVATGKVKPSGRIVQVHFQQWPDLPKIARLAHIMFLLMSLQMAYEHDGNELGRMAVVLVGAMIVAGIETVATGKVKPSGRIESLRANNPGTFSAVTWFTENSSPGTYNVSVNVPANVGAMIVAGIETVATGKVKPSGRIELQHHQLKLEKGYNYRLSFKTLFPFDLIFFK